MKDRVLAAVVAAVAIAYLYSDWRIPRLELGDPLGPRAFPALVGILLLISTVLLALETRRGGQASAVAADRSGPSHVPVLAGILVWTIGYYAVFDVAGYIIATIVYLFGLLCVFHKGRHKSNALIAAGFTAAAYGIFSQLLNVQLPLGPLSF
jgi:putative tricarboxylic transport membrane protein